MVLLDMGSIPDVSIRQKLETLFHWTLTQFFRIIVLFLANYSPAKAIAVLAILLVL